MGRRLSLFIQLAATALLTSPFPSDADLTVRRRTPETKQADAQRKLDQEKKDREQLLTTSRWFAKFVVPSMLEAYPEAHFVSVGRSPTPIQALLEEVLPDNISALPLSFHGRLEGESLQSNEALKQKLFAHFDRFLPPEKPGTPLVFVDWSLSIENGTLVNVALFAEEYLKSRNRHDKIAFFDFGEKAVRSLREKGYAVAVPKEDTHGEFSGRLSSLGEPYDDHSEYPSFRIRTDQTSESLKPRSEYLAFKKEMREELALEILYLKLKVADRNKKKAPRLTLGGSNAGTPCEYEKLLR